MNDNFTEEMQKKMTEVDPERMGGYIDLFDRLLLYTMAVQIMPPEILEKLLKKWEHIIKATIDMESNIRTTYLEETPHGRSETKHEQPDGEELRLNNLKTLNMAKLILDNNLQSPKEEENDDLD